MKNGRHNDNDSKRRADSTNAATGRANADGGNIRTDDRNESAVSGEIKQQRTDVESGNESNQSNATNNKQLSLSTGYYFTPRGDVARIPDGYTIGSDGRLRKQRTNRRDGSNAADGDSHRDRSETGESEILDTEIPLREVSGVKRKTKKVTESQQRLTMVAMLSVATTAIFTSISLLTKHDHWNLDSTEAKILAEALNESFQTLPTKYYEQIIAIIEKWIPWVNLIFVISAIIIPRIEASAKRIEDSHYKQNQNSNSGNAGTENNPFNDWKSVGYSQ